MKYSGGGSTTIWVYLIALNCTSENGYNGKFYVIYVLPQWKPYITHNFDWLYSKQNYEPFVYLSHMGWQEKEKWWKKWKESGKAQTQTGIKELYLQINQSL